MRDNPIQFAVVREDPDLDLEVARGCRRALLIASGGCTALALQARLDLDITVLDPNPAQLDLVRRKVDALHSDRRVFNVENDDPAGLSECGNFESLFRGLRGFLYDFVLPYDGMRAIFEDADPAVLFSSPYWPTAFALWLSDPLLHTMFGPDATQHAAPGSYPGYFQALFERGLTAPGAADNPFLHHVLLGHYLERALPRFLEGPPPSGDLRYVEGYLDAVDLGDFDFVGLSNILDWMPPEAIAALVEQVVTQTRPGTVVMWRQLNNQRDLQALFAPTFRFEDGRRLHATDRSLFYSSVHVGRR